MKQIGTIIKRERELEEALKKSIHMEKGAITMLQIELSTIKWVLDNEK